MALPDGSPNSRIPKVLALLIAAAVALCLAAGCASAPPATPAPTPVPTPPLPESTPTPPPQQAEEETTYCVIPGFGGNPAAIIATNQEGCQEIDEELQEAAVSPEASPGASPEVSAEAKPEHARILSKAEVASLLGPELTAPGPPRNVYILYFDLDSVEPKEGSEVLLRLAVRDIGGRAAPDVTIDGHTDTKGDRAYNDRLSLRRAKAVADLLAARGVNVASFKVIAHGASALLVPTGDQTDEPRNRRVEITVR